MQHRTIAILSSGPSLLKFDPSERFDLRIGVNRAATVHACDWWVAGDEQAIWRHTKDPDAERQGLVIGHPGVFTLSPAWAAVMHGDRALFDSFREWLNWDSDKPRALCPPTEWDCWSAGAAIVLAAYLGATELHLFGYDMAGEQDFAGYNDPGRSRYNPIRWERERRIMPVLLDWIAGRGCRVVNRSGERKEIIETWRVQEAHAA